MLVLLFQGDNEFAGCTVLHCNTALLLKTKPVFVPKLKSIGFRGNFLFKNTPEQNIKYKITKHVKGTVAERQMDEAHHKSRRMIGCRFVACAIFPFSIINSSISVAALCFILCHLVPS